ncbi:dihydropteroate synthase [Thiothrix nivea]|uniref:Dihydropteroate synthase n=1 Tax=Thiothrix nivea (strain ATCC 35100 / DSM 5205 / JP2) TaxID=870187 RepID=A0A656HCD0_THINJ|nr:dihydropteroate synthase [Thiothrix nivea]EIJ34057.1 Dihydropteroate synthase [Thiothrix nivea DSM 5205]
MAWQTIESSIQVMGILNVTPDSFSDGGLFQQREAALRQVEQMLVDGADIIDVGGESTRPGAQPVSVQAELDRVVPVIAAIRERFEVVVSVDTSKPEVMLAAVGAGADMVNDVRALQEPGALEACSRLRVPVCLMHMQGQPRTMQQSPHYHDVVQDISRFFVERIAACGQVGIARERLILDPGFGFGKNLQHNVALLSRLDEFSSLGLPILAGISRKSMIGALLGNRPVDGRLYGSVAAAVIAAMKGASILRVHDVLATADAIKLVAAVISNQQRG